ncbi:MULTISPECIES: DUF3093 domain-containing protein [Streptomyces]|nr:MULTISPECIES: DUF3093 domain-containing protein [Streptomyces]QIB42732.1 DUF3093 domain-containing protein [Streptomyces aureoverticillatus]
MHLYDERLTVPAVWWFLVVLGGCLFGGLLLPFGPVAAAAGVVLVGAVFGPLVHRYGSARIVVTPGTLLVGDRAIPIDDLGTTEILDAGEAFEWRTYKANAYALLLLRGYVPTALRVELRGPHHRAPYLYLSTRRPMNLATILAFTRR